MSKTALITGASAGLGVEFANQLAATGVDLILVARRKEKLEEVAKRLREKYDVEVTTVSADLADREAPRELFEFTRSANLTVDYLINNAGSSGPTYSKKRNGRPRQSFSS